MTNEEAKEIFLNRGFVNGLFDGDKWRQSIVVISKWLEQESCEDAISRKALKHKLQEHYDFFVNAYGGISNLTPRDKSRVDEIINCIAMVVNEPSIQPKPKTGHWEQYGNSWEDKFKCSECGKEQPKILCGERIIGHWSDYCPNCGAKMESEDKE